MMVKIHRFFMQMALTSLIKKLGLLYTIGYNLLNFQHEYDLHINNGRMLEHFHEGNMTNKSKGIQSKVPEVFVEVSPELAKERGIKDGTLLRLVSPYGALKLNALVTDRVQGNELFLPMNSVSKDSAINFLTGPLQTLIHQHLHINKQKYEWKY